LWCNPPNGKRFDLLRERPEQQPDVRLCKQGARVEVRCPKDPTGAAALNFIPERRQVKDFRRPAAN